jgi:hypothetical protein
MIIKSEIILSAAIILAAGWTTATRADGPPKLNMEYACHASERAVSAIFSVTFDIYGSCMTDEQSALDELKKDWASFPASDKARCIQPKEYLPSYVEWLTCLGMARDVKAMRKGQPGPQTTTDKCPVVRFHEDGTIISVDAC